jgi:hypothetical protein
MSALPPKADIAERDRDVRFVPKADIAAETGVSLFAVSVARPTERCRSLLVVPTPRLWLKSR